MNPKPGGPPLQGIGTRQPSRPMRSPLRAEEDGVLPQLVGEVDLLEPELLALVDEHRSRQREQEQRGRPGAPLAFLAVPVTRRERG